MRDPGPPVRLRRPHGSDPELRHRVQADVRTDYQRNTRGCRRIPPGRRAGGRRVSWGLREPCGGRPGPKPISADAGLRQPHRGRNRLRRHTRTPQAHTDERLPPDPRGPPAGARGARGLRTPRGSQPVTKPISADAGLRQPHRGRNRLHGRKNERLPPDSTWVPAGARRLAWGFRKPADDRPEGVGDSSNARTKGCRQIPRERSTAGLRIAEGLWGLPVGWRRGPSGCCRWERSRCCPGTTRSNANGRPGCRGGRSVGSAGLRSGGEPPGELRPGPPPGGSGHRGSRVPSGPRRPPPRHPPGG